LDDEPAPISLFVKRPKSGARTSAIETLGARTMRAYRGAGALLQTLMEALAAPLIPGRAARAVANQLAMRQVFFTGAEALTLVSIIAAFVGATMILQMRLMAAAVPGEVVGQVLVAVILRELAPLTTAIIVAGRSGTAIATELGNMRVNAEVFALASLGIDPQRFIVWPRMVGCVVSVMVLTVYFGAIAILGGHAVGAAMGASSLSELRIGFSEALGPPDLVLYFVKTIGLGTLVGWLSCHYGLSVQGSPTEVPQQASAAVIYSLLASVVYNAAVTAGFYWIVGPPVG
jgi:phospholipid/cholesterol/gamma-HCH transport system permease protein